MAMRRLITFVLTASLGTVMTACGGGGTSSTPAAAPAPASPSAPGAPIQGVTNYTGPSGSVTVSIKVPAPKVPASAAQRARAASFRAAHASRIRSLANTSPSASIRAAASSASRQPAFISPSTYSLEFVVTDTTNTTVLADQFQYGNCTAVSCTNTFAAPVGVGMNVTLYLYDNSYYLIAAGTVSGISVTLGNTTVANVTLDGVATYLDVTTTNPGPFLGDPSGSATFNVAVTPRDVNGNPITTPGIVLDSTFTPIASVTLSVDTDTTPALPQTLNPQADLSFGPPVPYTFQGLGPESSINFTATEVPAGGGPIIVADNRYGPYGTQTGSLAIVITPVSLQWTNQGGYPILSSDPSTNLPSSSGTVEFPLATNAGPYTFGLADTSTTFGANITLSAAGCGGVTSSYAPGLGSQTYASLSSGSYFQITMGSAAATNTCVITATDGTNTATLSLYTDQTSLLIQNKARKH